MGRVSPEEADRHAHFADCAYLSFKDLPLFRLIIPAKLQTYLACGAPVLAAAGGDTAAIIHEAQCGIAADPNCDALVQAVKQMMELTSEQRQHFGKNALSYSLAHFDKDTLLDELEAIMGV